MKHPFKTIESSRTTSSGQEMAETTATKFSQLNHIFVRFSHTVAFNEPQIPLWHDVVQFITITKGRVVTTHDIREDLILLTKAR